MSISATIERIDPELAQALLDTQTTNRVVTASNVKNLTFAILNNGWLQDGAPLRISSRGELLDGQHRLLAVIAAGVPVDFLVVRGVDKGAQFVMDTGKKRSLADALSMNGEKSVTRLGALISAFYKWELKGARNSTLVNGGFVGGITPPIPELLEFFNAHHDAMVEAVRESDRIRGRAPVTPRNVALTYLLFSRISQADAAIFFEALATGSGLETGSPILALRNKLASSRISTSQGGHKVEYYEELALIVKAWNFWRQGLTVTKLSFRAGGGKPEAFPEPV